MLVLIVLLAILCLASVGVVVWVCIEMHKNKRDFKRRWKRLGKEKSKIGKRLDEMSKEDSKINKTLVGIDERHSKINKTLVGIEERLSKEDEKINKTLVGIEMRLSKEDEKINKTLVGIEKRVGSLSKEDEKINERISKISETDEAIRSDVAKMRPLLNVANVDASGNLRIAKDRQFCIDTECVSSHDIPKMKKAPLPPFGSVWRCDAVKVDNGAIDAISVTFRMEGPLLNIRFIDIGGDTSLALAPPILVDEDPTNTSKSKSKIFYPREGGTSRPHGLGECREGRTSGGTGGAQEYDDGTIIHHGPNDVVCNPGEVLTSFKPNANYNVNNDFLLHYTCCKIPGKWHRIDSYHQRLFPMAFAGYDIGSKCTFNFMGWATMELDPERYEVEVYANNSPAVFTRVS
jgi:hypothetical protein